MNRISRAELETWFADPKWRGVASNAELARLLAVSEGFVRGEGRNRGCRRIGGAICWTAEDALKLFDDLVREERRQQVRAKRRSGTH